jgi:hypothetical protein
VAFKAQLLLKDRAPDERDFVLWKWLKGEQTLPGAFGDPLTTDGYTLCIYDDSPSVLLAATAPAGGTCDEKPCWKISRGDFKYRDRERTPDGLEQIKLQAGDDGDAKISVKGKGENLALPTLPLALPVLVQLQATNGECWEATHSEAGVIKNDTGQFKGKAD